MRWLNLIEGLVTRLLRRAHSEVIQIKNTQLKSSGAEEFKNVYVATKRLPLLIYTLLSVICWALVLYSGLGLLALLGLMDFDTFLFIAFANAIPLLFITVIASLTQSNGFYANNSMFGSKHDMRVWSENDWSILVNKKGIQGMLDVSWGDVSKIEKQDGLTATLRMTRSKTWSDPASLIFNRPSLSIKFESENDCDRFISLYYENFAL